MMTEGSMRSLEQAVALMERWKPERAKDREQVLNRINGLSSSCNEAIEIWQGYLDSPGPAGDKWTILSWVGPARAKMLHEINLKAGELLHQACAIAGPEAERIHVYEDSLIEMAYRQFKPGETGPDVARSAIEKMRAHRAYLDQLMARIRSIQFAKPRVAAKGAASARPAAKKSSGKKAKKALKTKAPVRSAKKTKAKKAKKKPARPAKKPARKTTARRK